MKIEFRESFINDIKKIKDKKLQNRIKEIIIKVEKANLKDIILEFKKLKGTKNFYSYRIGDYRIGVVIEKDKLIFVRFLHRKDIYRYFP